MLHSIIIIPHPFSNQSAISMPIKEKGFIISLFAFFDTHEYISIL
ncbi:hypothetical protein HMPREF9406_2417 [Clostridium sp. HGF2]|nr:hypothetical protein HMPREF9406_2417 [Clostridium sp. HGF2]